MAQVREALLVVLQWLETEEVGGGGEASEGSEDEDERYYLYLQNLVDGDEEVEEDEERGDPEFNPLVYGEALNLREALRLRWDEF